MPVKCTDSYSRFDIYMVFSRTKVVDIGQHGNRELLFICVWLNQANHHPESSAMADYQYRFSFSDRYHELDQLTNEKSYQRKKLQLHLNWVIINARDFDIDHHVCMFFPTLSHHRHQLIPLAQPEVCPQRSERLVRPDSQVPVAHLGPTSGADRTQMGPMLAP